MKLELVLLKLSEVEIFCYMSYYNVGNQELIAIKLVLKEWHHWCHPLLHCL